MFRHILNTDSCDADMQLNSADSDTELTEVDENDEFIEGEEPSESDVDDSDDNSDDWASVQVQPKIVRWRLYIMTIWSLQRTIEVQLVLYNKLI